MKTSLLFFLCLWTYSGMAQPNAISGPKIQWGLSYLHNGASNPGMQFHFDWVFRNRLKRHKREGKKRGEYFQITERQFVAESRLGFYWNPLTHWVIFNHYLISYRFVYRKPDAEKASWAISIGLGPGYYHSLLPETYEVDAQGNIKDLGLAGRGYFSTILDFKFVRERPGKSLSAWFFGLNTFFLHHYNATLASTGNLYFGYRFSLAKPKSK